MAPNETRVIWSKGDAAAFTAFLADLLCEIAEFPADSLPQFAIAVVPAPSGSNAAPQSFTLYPANEYEPAYRSRASHLDPVIAAALVDFFPRWQTTITHGSELSSPKYPLPAPPERSARERIILRHMLAEWLASHGLKPSAYGLI